VTGILRSAQNDGLAQNDEFLTAEDRRCLRAAGKVWVACSGGPDSVFLLELLLELMPEITVGVLHVNYGLRGEESDGDERFVRQIAEERGLECLIRKVDPAAVPSSGIQLWARDLRYEWFDEIARKFGGLIALGHHLDDEAETVLLRMARGVSTGKLKPMERLRGPFFRPLLGVSKATITEALARQNLPFRVDSSNDKLNYDRNVVRHKILLELEGLYPDAAERLVSLAYEASDLAEFVRNELRPRVSGESVDVDWLGSLKPGVAFEAIALFASAQFGRSTNLSRSQLYVIWEAVVGKKTFEIEVQRGCYLKVECGHLKAYTFRKAKYGSVRYEQHRHNIESPQAAILLGTQDRAEIRVHPTDESVFKS
jgi:tRNA(Ile)-lysidine synthetase-like protein